MKIQEEATKLINKFQTLYPKRKLLFFYIAGSHFFDLATENSDIDFRGVYLPSPEDYYNGESRRGMIDWKTQSGRKGIKNTKEDIDCSIFSLTKFIELLKSGDFNMMELLFTPKDKIIVNSNIMKNYRNIRKSILVNDISSFLGFIKKEYKRYGINIYHYQAQENFLNFLMKYKKHTRLKDIWNDIEEYAKNEQHIQFTELLTNKTVYVPAVKIAQRAYHNTVKIDYVQNALIHNLSTYGHRQKDMAKSGVEFKGLYHALRLIYEANDLIDFGEFHLPFSQSRHELLFKIKNSTIQKNELFSIIDGEIEKLKIKEYGILTNKKQVESILDKLLFSIQGKMKIKHLMGKS